MSEDFRHFIIEAHDGNGAGLFARETDDIVFPINVFSFEARQIGLRRAQMPRQFIERFAFRIQFAGDDGLVFLPGDGAFVLKLNFWPLPFYDDGQGSHVMSRRSCGCAADKHWSRLFRFRARANSFPASFPKPADAG